MMGCRSDGRNQLENDRVVSVYAVDSVFIIWIVPGIEAGKV